MRSSVPGAGSSTPFIFAAVLGTFAVLLIWGGRWDSVAQADLETLHGTVFRVETRATGKAAPKINIYLQDGARVFHLIQDDFACNLQSLRPHDQVTAWAKRDSLGRGLFWLWQLDRGNIRLLSYDETLAHETSAWEGLRIFGITPALMAAALGLLGIRRGFSIGFPRL